ncbi:MAG: hypothetical protein KF846_13895 [Cyclobacteriaceae bacterium]|nr:hypothetical protein [Cyclobacteriaceae bacterium]
MKIHFFSETRFTRIVLTYMLIALASTFSRCSSGDEPTANKPRKVRYEITGNFSGTFTVVYTALTGGSRVENNVPIGWSMEMDYPASTLSISIGAQASTLGSPGQTAVIRIYVNEKQVKSSQGIAGSLGEIVIPTIAYSF